MKSYFLLKLIPPLIGFFSKQFVLYSAIESGYYFMSILAILVSVISASYYLKIIRLLHTDIDTNSIKENNKLLNNIINNNNNYNNLENIETETVISNFHSLLISVLTLSILLFIFKPSIILNSTQLLSLSLFNN